MAPDRVVRAMTREGTFRVVAARTTDAAAKVVRAQEASGADAQVLGDLVTLSVLYREMMAPTMRAQILLRGAQASGQAVAESHPDGWVRGLLKRPGERELDLVGEGALLSLQRPLRSGEIHVGTVAVPTDCTLASAAMVYFDHSEQVKSMVALGTALANDDGGRVVASGGFIVQLLAEAKDHEGPLAVMTERLEEFVHLVPRLLETDASPDHLVDEVLYGFEIDRLSESPVSFGCLCSEERFLAALSTLGDSDFAELTRGTAPIESRCDFCGRVLSVTIDRAVAFRRGGT